MEKFTIPKFSDKKAKIFWMVIPLSIAFNEELLKSPPESQKPPLQEVALRGDAHHL